MTAARRVHLDDLHLVTAFDGLGQTLADLPATGDDDALVGLVETAHFAHDRPNVRPCGNEKHFVVRFDHRIALGQDRPVATENRRHAGFDVGHVLAQLAQLLPHQRPAVVGPHRNQLRLAFGEVDHLQGARMLDQALDVVGDYLLGADQHIHRDGFVVEQFGAGQVRRFTDAGDLGRCMEKGMGNLAGHHIGFIAAGHGDQHVGIIGASLAQNTGQRTAALYRTDVQSVAEVTQAFAIGVDHGNVIRFACQVLRQRTADLPRSEDDDFHPVTPLNPFNRVRRRS
ncbi:hypothetical protein D3C76_1027820 [compost metagenome]